MGMKAAVYVLDLNPPLAEDVRRNVSKNQEMKLISILFSFNLYLSTLYIKKHLSDLLMRIHTADKKLFYF